MTTAANSDAGGTIWVVDFDFDTLSRLTSEEQGPSTADQKTISSTYDSCGNRLTCTYFSSFRLDYTSDDLGRWTKIENHANGNDLVTWSYSGPGRRIAVVCRAFDSQ